MNRYFLGVCVFLFTLLSCTMNDFEYDLNLPGKVVELSKKLNEISGLEYVRKDTLACVQDETADLYFLNPNNGEVYDKVDFGGKGDYEGVAKYKKKYYVLKSNGDLTRVSKKGKTKKFEFENSKGFNFEGLCYDSLNNRMLIACKEHKKKKSNHSIYIYGFSLETKEYLKEPIFIISKNTLGKGFLPSGIAIHPSGNIYIPSAFSNQLLVLANSGEVLNLLNLKYKDFNQAEGICFGDRGELYISNEKGNGFPNLMTFEQKK